MSAPINPHKINARERTGRDGAGEIADALRDLAATIARPTEAASKGEQQ